MPKISSFRDLLVWQKAMALAEGVYRFSKEEGFGRHSTAEYIHHLRFSKGSINEVQTQVELARRLDLGREAETVTIITDAEEIGRMLNGLVQSLRR